MLGSRQMSRGCQLQLLHFLGNDADRFSNQPTLHKVCLHLVVRLRWFRRPSDSVEFCKIWYIMISIIVARTDNHNDSNDGNNIQ